MINNQELNRDTIKYMLFSCLKYKLTDSNLLENIIDRIVDPNINEIMKEKSYHYYHKYLHNYYKILIQEQYNYSVLKPHHCVKTQSISSNPTPASSKS